MKKTGRVLLLIGAILLLVFGILNAISLILTLIDGTFTADWTASIMSIVWIAVDIIAGLAGINYFRGKGAFKGLAPVFSWIVLVLFIIDLVMSIISIVQSGFAGFASISTVIYGGIAGILYVVGYFMQRK
ncbi:MAG: hypothetical protein WC174_00060 [Bacilli bacterium]